MRTSHVWDTAHFSRVPTSRDREWHFTRSQCSKIVFPGQTHSRMLSQLAPARPNRYQLAHGLLLGALGVKVQNRAAMALRERVKHALTTPSPARWMLDGVECSQS